MAIKYIDDTDDSTEVTSNYSGEMIHVEKTFPNGASVEVEIKVTVKKDGANVPHPAITKATLGDVLKTGTIPLSRTCTTLVLPMNAGWNMAECLPAK